MYLKECGHRTETNSCIHLIMLVFQLWDKANSISGLVTTGYPLGNWVEYIATSHQKEKWKKNELKFQTKQ